MTSNILVTGATGYLGSSFCKAAAENDYHVIGTHQPGNKSPGLKGTDLHDLDLMDSEAVSDFVSDMKTKYKKIRAAVLLAGGFSMSNIETTSNIELMEMYNTNFLTAFNMVKPVYKWLKETGGGKIVMVSAKPVFEGGASEMLPYVLAKSNIKQLSEILNETGGKDKITTSVVVPSIIDTPANRLAMPDAKFKEWVSSDEIAGNILHLISGFGSSLRNPVLKIYGNS